MSDSPTLSPPGVLSKRLSSARGRNSYLEDEEQTEEELHQKYMAIRSYVPLAVMNQYKDKPAIATEPSMDTFMSSILFADISGFTPLTEKMGREHGPEGAEFINRYINDYFTRLIEVVNRYGGDVLKFAGDAILCVWPAGIKEEEMTDTPSGKRSKMSLSVLRACKCALEIQGGELASFAPIPGDPLRLKLKCLVTAGQIFGIHVGGVRDRWEYIVAGYVPEKLRKNGFRHPIEQISDCEDDHFERAVICSKEAFLHLSKDHKTTKHPKGLVEARETRVYKDEKDKKGNRSPRGTWSMIKVTFPDGVKEQRGLKYPSDEDGIRMMMALRTYIPLTVRPKLDALQLQYLQELRTCSVVFVNLPGLEVNADSALDITQQVVTALFTCLYRYNGGVRQFITDDKGTVLIGVFGLPPETERCELNAVLCGLEMLETLRTLEKIDGTVGVSTGIGIATGNVFCGNVGAPHRREYAVVGDTVNFSARLMAKSQVLTWEHANPGEAKGKNEYALLVSESTFNGVNATQESEARSPASALNRDIVEFNIPKPAKFKGKTNLLNIYEPVKLSARDQIERQAARTEGANGQPSDDGTGDSKLTEAMSRLGSGVKMKMRNLVSKARVSKIVGWTEQRRALEDRLLSILPAKWRPGDKPVILMTGEEGMGKTKVAQELVYKAAVVHKVSTLNPIGASEQGKPYSAWDRVLNTCISSPKFREFLMSFNHIAPSEFDIHPEAQSQSAGPAKRSKRRSVVGCGQSSVSPSSTGPLDVADHLNLGARLEAMGDLHDKLSELVTDYEYAPGAHMSFAQSIPLFQDIFRLHMGPPSSGEKPDLEEHSEVTSELVDENTGREKPAFHVARQKAVVSLLKFILTNAVVGGRAPVCIVVDNATRMDKESRDLMVNLYEALPQVMLVMSSRPLEQASSSFTSMFEEQLDPYAETMELEEFSEDDTRDLIVEQLAACQEPQMKPEDIQCDEETVRLILSKVPPNPFLIHELMKEMTVKQRVIVNEAGVMTVAPNFAAMKLPSTIESYMTSRIDKLEPAQQLTLKVASVCAMTPDEDEAQSFMLSLMLSVYPQDGVRTRKEAIVSNLFALIKYGLLVPMDGDANTGYITEQAACRDPSMSFRFLEQSMCKVTYRLMLFRQRQQFHKGIGDFLEEELESGGDNSENEDGDGESFTGDGRQGGLSRHNTDSSHQSGAIHTIHEEEDDESTDYTSSDPEDGDDDGGHNLSARDGAEAGSSSSGLTSNPMVAPLSLKGINDVDDDELMDANGTASAPPPMTERTAEATWLEGGAAKSPDSAQAPGSTISAITAAREKKKARAARKAAAGAGAATPRTPRVVETPAGSKGEHPRRNHNLDSERIIALLAYHYGQAQQPQKQQKWAHLAGMTYLDQCRYELAVFNLKAALRAINESPPLPSVEGRRGSTSSNGAPAKATSASTTRSGSSNSTHSNLSSSGAANDGTRPTRSPSNYAEHRASLNRQNTEPSPRTSSVSSSGGGVPQSPQSAPGVNRSKSADAKSAQTTIDSGGEAIARYVESKAEVECLLAEAQWGLGEAGNAQQHFAGVLKSLGKALPTGSYAMSTLPSIDDVGEGGGGEDSGGSPRTSKRHSLTSNSTAGSSSSPQLVSSPMHPLTQRGSIDFDCSSGVTHMNERRRSQQVFLAQEKVNYRLLSEPKNNSRLIMAKAYTGLARTQHFKLSKEGRLQYMYCVIRSFHTIAKLETDSLPEYAKSCAFMPHVAFLRGSPSKAIQYADQARKSVNHLPRESKEKRGTIAYVDWGLGLYEAQIGNLQEAIGILERSLKLLDLIAQGDDSQRVEVAADYAFVLYATGAFLLATQHGAMVYASWEKKYAFLQPAILPLIASGMLSQGLTEESATACELLATVIENKAQDVTADDRLMLEPLHAWIMIRRGKLTEAFDYLKNAHRWLYKLGGGYCYAMTYMLPIVQTIECTLGLWWLSLTQPQLCDASLKSKDLQEKAKQSCLQLRDYARLFPIANPRLNLLRGLYDYMKKKKAKARTLWEEGLEEAERQGNNFEATNILFWYNAFDREFLVNAKSQIPITLVASMEEHGYSQSYIELASAMCLQCGEKGPIPLQTHCVHVGGGE